MILHLYFEDNHLPFSLSDTMVTEAAPFFARMDSDMDRGWQVSREWVESPDTVTRCKIAADRLLTAIETENLAMAQLMAGYIVTKIPGVYAVRINTEGEIQETQLLTSPQQGQ
jgi:hypothetical protein